MKRKRLLSGKFWSLAILLLAGAALVVHYMKLPQTEKIRVGIMPMNPMETTGAFTTSPLAEQLVEGLRNLHEGNFEIIGPAITKTFDPENMWEEMDAQHLDILINGRFMKVNYQSTVLMEVIRVSDGAHIWVRSFDANTKPETIVSEVEKGLLSSLSALESVE